MTDRVHGDTNLLGTAQMCILLAVEAGEITEMRAARMLATDLVTMRGWKLTAIEQGRRLATEDGYLISTPGECRRRHCDD